MSYKKLKVLHIIPAIQFGGLEKIAIQLAAEQVRSGIDAKVLTLYENQKIRQFLDLNNLKYYQTRGQRFNPGGCIDYIKYLREFKPDLVHLHLGLLWSNFIGLTTKNCPWVFHAHVNVDGRDGIKQKINNYLVSNLCDAFIGISNFVSGSLHTITGKRNRPVYTVYNGIPVSNSSFTRRSINSENPLYGMATRLAPGKGVMEFTQVAGAITDKQPGARFILAGDGPYFDKVQDRVRALGLENRFELPGFISDIDSFWNKIDIAVFTAPGEPFGLRILEPMLHGVPVVAYKTGAGSDEIIDDGKTGIHVEWGDVETFAQKCIELSNNSEFYHEISKSAYEDVIKKFSLKKMTTTINSIYRGMLSHKYRND